MAYCRVSSPAQRPDLQNQRAALEQYTQARGIVVDEWVLEIGRGLNFERKRFLAVVDAIVVGEVKCLVIAHQDRLARFGFPLLRHLCEIHETELLVMNTETLSPEQELVQDLMSIVHQNCGKETRLRSRDGRKCRAPAGTQPSCLPPLLLFLNECTIFFL